MDDDLTLPYDYVCDGDCPLCGCDGDPDCQCSCHGDVDDIDYWNVVNSTL